ncbi:MAG: glycosyltransferase family 4 protein [Candidatus Omnitrophica bacterium]|nr:glycosyltransferase family 4 protein [Candidatus Omnitrophota bacterium]
MKIVHIITRMIIGGAQENTLYTVTGLLQKGYDVTLVSGPSSGPEGSLEELIRQKNIPFKKIRNLVRQINPFIDVIAFFRIAMLLRKERFDIVHTHSAKAGILGRVAAGIFSPSSITIHTIHGLSFHPYQNRLKNRFYVFYEKIADFFTDYYVSVSEIMVKRCLDAGIGKKKKFSIIRSGFDVKKYMEADTMREKTRQALGIKENEILLGMIGRLFYLKGHDYLLNVFSKMTKDYPGLKLLIIGGGILQNKFETFVKKNNISEKVIFTGLVKGEKIPELVSAMDFGVHTSLREGLPKAVAQIMAGGKPVIAFDVDGTKEIVRDSFTGFLVPAKDEVILEEKISILIKDPVFRQKMGNNSRKIIEQNFSTEKMLDEIEKLYLNIVNTR